MTGPIFDTHAHYSARAFDADRFALLDSLPEKGVVGVCEQATHSGDAPRVLELAHRYPWVVAAVGIHPESLLPAADCGEEGPAPTVSVYGGDWAAEMRALAPYYEDPKVVAVGECGLDYHWPVPKDAQLAMFEAHIRLALELDKRYHKKEMPSRIKMGVAGCPNSCAEVHVKDVGFIGTENGWDVYVGGSAGSHPRLADKLITSLNYDDTLRIVDIIVKYYQKNADIERVGQFIDRIGFEKFKTDVLGEFENDIISLEQEKPYSQTEVLQPVPGGLTEGTLVFGDMITAQSIIADIIRVYPQTIPVLRSFGMGCLGCPSATGEELQKAADIHGIEVNELITSLNEIIVRGEN